MINSRATSPSRTSNTRPPLLVDGLFTLAALLLFACTGMVFIFPWLPAFPVSGLTLNRYIPISDGDAWLGEQVTQAGAVHSFRSVNIQILAHQHALSSDLHLADFDELRKFVQKPGETNLDDSQFTRRISTMQIIFEEDQTLAAGGAVDRSNAVILRTASGDYQLAIFTPTDNSDLVFDPPLLLRPADFRPGATWQTAGTLGNFQYHSTGSIAAEPSYQGPLGNLNDCRKVSLRLAIQQQGQTINDTTYLDWFCSGVGQVAEQELDPNGQVLTRTQVVSSSHYANGTAQRQPVSPMPAISLLDASAQNAPTAMADPATWVLAMLGRTRTANDTTESTVQPVWVPTNPPLLLVAGQGGDLLALDITRAPGQVLWRYHPNGTIYGQPSYDSSRQQVYFGDSGKQLVALDLRGLFRWSFTCGDNIVTRPVVVGDSLVFGSEDRNVYALDARSGALLWKYTTGAAVVASPAVNSSTVMIGSDDGVVYAFNAASGKKQWVFSTGQAVEAPLISADGTVFIASRDMNLYALRVSSGKLLWQTQIGNILRTQPALGKDAVYLIDENGHISAVGKADGKLLWTSVEHDYEGAPVLVGQTLLAAANGGVLYRLSEEGNRLSSISGTSAAPVLQDIDFRLGLAAGGGAVWMVDTKGYIWRFGPVWNAAQPLELAWSSSLNDPPFKQSPFYSPPQVWQSLFILADQAGNLYQIDPSTGQSTFRGSFANQAGNFRSGLVVRGDFILASSGNVLYAVHLPEFKPLWHFQAQGFGLIPAVVDGDRLAWVTGGSGDQAHLNLLDLQTGRLIWSVNLDGVSVPGNAMIHAGIVYVNSPISAYRLDNGQKVWQVGAANSLGIGLAVLSPDSQTLYSQLTDPNSLQNRITAISTQDGSLRWLASLGKDNVSLIGTLSLDGNILVVPLNSGTRSILALDSATGKELWRYTPDQPRLGNPTIHQGKVWFILQNGQIVALDMTTGREIARLGLTQAYLESYDFVQSIAFSDGYALASAGWSLLEVKIPGGMQP